MISTSINMYHLNVNDVLLTKDNENLFFVIFTRCAAYVVRNKGAKQLAVIKVSYTMTKRAGGALIVSHSVM